MIFHVLILLFVAMVGAIFGSFANVLIIRMKDATSILGRSRCMSCQAVIRPRHLVPIFSWLMLRGRCADCGARIHIQYPLVEFGAAIFAIMAFIRHDPTLSIVSALNFFFEFFFALDLLVLATFDLRWKLLPLEFMWGSSVVFGLWSILTSRVSWSATLIGGAVAIVFLGLQVIISKGKWLGDGDPWLGLLLGLSLGWPSIGISLYLTYIFGAAVAIVLLIGRFVKLKERIAFGPLLVAGGLGALWFSDSILSWLDKMRWF